MPRIQVSQEANITGEDNRCTRGGISARGSRRRDQRVIATREYCSSKPSRAESRASHPVIPSEVRHGSQIPGCRVSKLPTNSPMAAKRDSITPWLKLARRWR
jgi:hypothetical protein